MKGLESDLPRSHSARAAAPRKMVKTWVRTLASVLGLR